MSAQTLWLKVQILEIPIPHVPDLIQLTPEGEKSEIAQIVNRSTEGQSLDNRHIDMRVHSLLHREYKYDTESKFMKPILCIEQQLISKDLLIEFFEDSSFELTDADTKKIEEAVAGWGIEDNYEEDEIDVENEKVDDGIEKTNDELY